MPSAIACLHSTVLSRFRGNELINSEMLKN